MKVSYRIARGVLVALVIIASAPAGAAAHPHATSSAVSDWNANAAKAALAACLAPTSNPLHESRMYAMTQIAVHDALNAIHRRSEPYAYTARVRRRTSVDATVAAAAHGVLVPVLRQTTAPFTDCIGAAVASVEADYAAALAAIPESRAKARGIRLGEAAAAAIVARRARDGSDTLLIDTAFPDGTEPGEYRITPGSTFAFAPGWGRVTPFVLRDATQFRPGPPDPVTSPRYARDLNEVKALGSIDSTDRTPEQTEIANFWVESSPLQWNRIARTTMGDLDPWEQARLLGLLNMALADGYIGTFDTKYDYLYWRPVTAIRAADADGNPATRADPDWTPLQVTPPIPDYDSGHSVEGGAGAAVLARVLGDRTPFAACSFTLPAGSNCTEQAPVFRHYRRFSQAAAENGVSRIYVGFHFRKAVDEGVAHGHRIGDRAVDRFMRPSR